MKIINEFSEITEEFAIVDFFATWCGPCKRLSPFLESIQTEYPTVGFYKIDVDESEDLAEKYKVSAMPTVLLVRNGQELRRIIGLDTEEIKNVLEEYKNFY